jgi:hypothetical protein
MANLSTSSNISHHLTDHTGTPLFSTSTSTNRPSQSQSQSQALSSLTTAAITAYDTASRLGLGMPQRILVETSSPGPIILHSYLNPQPSQRVQARTPINGRGIVEQAREDLRWLSGTTDSGSVAENTIGGEGINGLLVNGVDYGKDVSEPEGEEEEDGNGRQFPPMLVGTVVAATAADAGEARRVAARLERMGREFQREWAREQELQSEPATGSGEEG